MGRNYTAEDYRSLVVETIAQMPDLCWGADVLAGFPGETEEDFRQTYELLESLPIAYLHVFPFSAREGTAAALLSNRVPSKIIQGRVSHVAPAIAAESGWISARRK